MVKEVVADILPLLWSSSSSEGSGKEGMALTDKLRLMPAESFVALLAAVFSAVSVRLARAAEIRAAMDQLAASAASTSGSHSVCRIRHRFNSRGSGHLWCGSCQSCSVCLCT